MTNPFDRTPRPPECDHPFHQLSSPMVEAGPGTTPRFVLTCTNCKQTWTGGHAMSIMLNSLQAKLREVERNAIAGSRNGQRAVQEVEELKKRF